MDGVTTNYSLVNGQVTKETDGTNTILYRYDPNGGLLSMNLNSTEYYYMKDGQGDIAGLIDSTGAVVVEYAYDAWGKILSVTGSLANTVGVLNPYRYRGYRFDAETGWYYLQSRYFEPCCERFINSDNISNQNGASQQNNLYKYCNNNPVKNFDPTGRLSTAGTNTKEEERINSINKTTKNVLVSNAIYALSHMLGNLLRFKNAVQTGGVWDYKQIKIRHDDPLTKSIADYARIYVSGTEMTWEQFGNFHYGYVGKKIYIPFDVLVAGSIYAAHGKIDANEKDDWRWILKGYGYNP